MLPVAGAIINSGHKAFDRQVNSPMQYFGECNVHSNTQYSMFIRGFLNTECNGRQVPPGAAGSEPPGDPFQDQPMVTEPVAPLALIRRHQRFDSRPELVRNHTHSRHRPIVTGQRPQIRETRPRAAFKRSM